MICKITNENCNRTSCQNGNCCKEEMLIRSIKEVPVIIDLTQIKAERVVIPCILIATKLLATKEQQKELEELLLKIKGNFIANLIKSLRNEVL